MASKNATDLLGALQSMFEKAIEHARDPRETTDIGWDPESSKITLPGQPEKMPYRTAIGVLMDKEAAENQEYELRERIPGMPLDAAYAFVQVLKERYGWVNAQTKQTMFGPEPPRMQMVKTGHGPEDYVEVPTGKFKLNDISTSVETGFAKPGPDKKSQFMDFFIGGTFNYKDRKVVLDLVSATRAYMAQHSIYKNKALRLTVNDHGDLDALIQPIFMDLSKVDTKALILNDDVQSLVDVALLTPIRRTDSCRKHKIPLKRGILLHGPYGTGKSLTATVTAKEAIEGGEWTFVIIDDVKALAQGLEFARQFQPCVVFAEDIDRIVDKNRSDQANDILNTIDSVVGKADEIITVLTTNHIEKIPPVMLRPGRLDALVPINVPDAKSAIRLVRHYARELVGVNDPLTGLAELLAEFLPSTIREVVERAKLSMLMHDRQQLTADDLKASANALKAHAALLADKEQKLSVGDEFAAAFKKLLNGHASANGSDIGEIIDRIDGNVDDVETAVGNYGDATVKRLDKIVRLVEQFAATNGQDSRIGEILEKVRNVEHRVNRN